MHPKIKAMMAARRRQIKSVYKCKYFMTGCPLGDFEAYMESPNSLPLVIRGQAGKFDYRGNWVKDTRQPA